MLTVFWCSTSYTVIIVPRKELMELVNAPARWWPCTCLKYVSGLWNYKKPWTIWDAFMPLTWCSNMAQTSKKETGYSFSLLHYSDGYSFLPYWIEFLSTACQVLDRTFLVLHLDGNVCKWIHKVIRPWMNWFWVFLFKNGFFRWLHIVTDWNLQWLLNCYSFWWHRFVWCLVWGVFGLLFKVVFTFQP